MPIILFLGACAGSAPATGSIETVATATLTADLVSQNTPVGTPTNNETETAELATTYENAVSIDMQLLLGQNSLIRLFSYRRKKTAS